MLYNLPSKRWKETKNDRLISTAFIQVLRSSELVVSKLTNPPNTILVGSAGELCMLGIYAIYYSYYFWL
jgi:hypothetical protein